MPAPRIYTGDLIRRARKRDKEIFRSEEEARTAILGFLDDVAAELAQGHPVQLEHVGSLVPHIKEGGAIAFGKVAGPALNVTLRDSDSLKQRFRAGRR